MTDILNGVNSVIFGTEGVWFLIGAALVFFMQCGFAMVETGFTRAKNAGNIIMKNLMDFCIGTVVFMLLGFGLLCGEDALFGLVGIPNLDIFTNFANFPWHNFVFNMVFCATTATIVSGAMAERTKFASYCIYSLVISAVVYPIEAHWIWGGGWLAQLGFIDFAGSCAIHMVGGISAIIGAIILGPRIGKYGKNGKVNAIPGHSLTLGALGVFILWFGWYGFNGAAAGDGAFLGQIFLTTTISPAIATCVTMLFTWIKNGKPDVSMSLNGSLAGLVAITAPCADVDAIGAAIIGLVAGILVVVAVEFIDIKLKIDDPVGAVAVHGVNGMWGTLSVGLFATGNGQDGITGLFYGGGFTQLGIQALGVVSVAAWTIVTMVIVFQLIKHTVGLRVTKDEEMKGLDVTEHGLVNAYADFMPIGVGTASLDETFDVEGNVPVTQAVPVQLAGNYDVASDGVKITKIDILLKQSKLEALKEEMDKLGITGMTVSQVLGCGAQKGKAEYYRGVAVESNLLPKMKVEIVVCKVPVKAVVDAAVKALYTGHIGDGKIFIYDVEDVVKVRTGETGYDAMQDVE
ncbi:ammonium transporter [uncultured Ruminococcus sp.]|uniref:ammonium transporter n=1 Tax=uncultured Ruminococcus sp. TaxID=165186 RepID=UPI0025D06678|nr:ammonium transporter [uncultured Ruminococcus sp.]